MALASSAHRTACAERRFRYPLLAEEEMIENNTMNKRPQNLAGAIRYFANQPVRIMSPDFQQAA
jgi:hypothetical protein